MNKYQIVRKLFERALTMDRSVESGVVGNLDTIELFVDDCRMLEFVMRGSAG